MKTEAWWLSPGISTLRKRRKEGHMSSRSSRVTQSFRTEMDKKMRWWGERWVERERDKEGSREMKRERKGEGTRKWGEEIISLKSKPAYQYWLIHRVL